MMAILESFTVKGHLFQLYSVEDGQVAYSNAQCYRDFLDHNDTTCDKFIGNPSYKLGIFYETANPIKMKAYKVIVTMNDGEYKLLFDRYITSMEEIIVLLEQRLK